MHGYRLTAYVLLLVAYKHILSRVNILNNVGVSICTALFQNISCLAQSSLFHEIISCATLLKHFSIFSLVQ